MILDLTGTPDTSAREGLLSRLSTLLDVSEGQLVLASTPDDAYRAVEAIESWISDDRSPEGLTGLDAPLKTDAAITLIRLGASDTPVSVLVCDEARIAGYAQEELSAPSQYLIQVGLDCLRPAARLKARADRAERDRLLASVARQLTTFDGITGFEIVASGLMVTATPKAEERLSSQFGLKAARQGVSLMLNVPDAQTAGQLADWMGHGENHRTATVRRTTKETDIALTVDLDGQGGKIDTGVHFFDHMLDQIARHGGIGLSVVCEGDVEVDSHHTIEDVCLALGEGLRDALGDKRGIARFGFETPMDETRASVWIDLSGRPYARFDGEIPGERVGDFPIEMCAHAFRSLAESLRAAIHVKVDGENAHHMVESCFKSFGRALRMAKTIEGDALPSTKGVL